MDVERAVEGPGHVDHVLQRTRRRGGEAESGESKHDDEQLSSNPTLLASTKQNTQSYPVFRGQPFIVRQKDAAVGKKERLGEFLRVGVDGDGVGGGFGGAVLSRGFTS